MADYTISNVGFNVDTSGLDQAQRKIENIGKTTEQSVNKTNTNLKQTKIGFDDISKAASTARGGIGALGGELAAVGSTGAAALGPIGVALLAITAAAAAAVGVFTTVVGQLKELHQINDVAEDLGVAATKFSEFAAAMEYGGVKVEDTTKILKQFSANINNAVEDNKKLAGAFTDLGLSTRELQAMNDPVEAFLISARKLADIEDINKRNAVSLELFGKKANEVLREVAQYENNLAEQNKLGNVATEERLQLAARQDDAFNKLAATGESLKNSLVDAFGPAITSLIESFATIMEGVAVVFKEISPLVRVFMDANQQLWTKTIEWIQPVINKLLEVRQMFIDLVERFGNTKFASFVGLDGIAKAYAQVGNNITVSLGLDPNAERTAKALTSSMAAQTTANIDNTTEAEKAAAAAKAKAEADKKAAEAAKQLAERQKALADATRKINDFMDETGRLWQDWANRLNAWSASIDVAKKSADNFAQLKGSSDLLVKMFDDLSSAARSAGLTLNGVTTTTVNTQDKNGNSIDTSNLATGNTAIVPNITGVTDQMRRQLSEGGKITGADLDKVVADYIKAQQERIDQQLVLGLANNNESAANAKTTTILELQQKVTDEVRIYNDIVNSGIKDADELNRLLDIRAQTQETINTLAAAGVKLTDDEKAAIEALIAMREKQANANSVALQKNAEEFNWIKEQAAGIGDTISNSILEALDTGRFSFKDFLYDIGEYLLQSNIKKIFASLFDTSSTGNGGWINTAIQVVGSFFGASQANGGAWSNGVQFFANGGIVNGATPFGMAGGRTGVMGEAGPEAIMPLVRGANGKLGVGVSGGGGGNTINTNITNNITVQNSDNPARDDEEAARNFANLANTIFDKRLSEQMRPGGMLNPTIQGYN